ncbi:cupin domain-containing protein [Amycolatopsis cynarae]|uniref:Cupin domain-containing protein n=1 Tax=Amycolatopsis cynarae TaxID=2995223 RepID=A0ABY7B9M7_9PSEU|nr:cupin domain-containing protein [Amycolatopsis sp. HUAS 11-8]WAL69064.1 cupin domain-containing protein [Amycolatopsis sp. HUAS 11-8]
MHVSRTPATSAAPVQWFTGQAWIDPIATPEGASRSRIDNVHFAPGARTAWHRHPMGQVLVVTQGTGLVQRCGGPVETIRTGDRVRIEPGEWHWHGATATSFLTHLAIEEIPEDGAEPELDRPVTDAEYQGGPQGTPATDTPPITRTVVLDQPLPAPFPTHRVEVRRIRIAAGQPAGMHVHNGPVFGSIEAGSVVYQIDGEPESLLTPGDTFYEPEGARIARFDAQEAGVTFLAYFPLKEGQAAELEFLDA